MLPHRTPAALAFSGAFIVTGAQTAPRCQRRVLWESIQGGTDLRQYFTGGNIGYARRLLHPIQQRLMLFHRTANLMIKRLNLRLQRGNRRKKHLQNEPVVIRKEALNGSEQFRFFTPELPTNTGLISDNVNRSRSVTSKCIRFRPVTPKRSDTTESILMLADSKSL